LPEPTPGVGVTDPYVLKQTDEMLLRGVIYAHALHGGYFKIRQYEHRVVVAVDGVTILRQPLVGAPTWEQGQNWAQGDIATVGGRPYRALRTIASDETTPDMSDAWALVDLTRPGPPKSTATTICSVCFQTKSAGLVEDNICIDCQP
jgi:hypothetical protein